MTDEAIKELARLFSMSIIEVADLARAFALAEIDPLKEPKGEVFVFQRQRPPPGPFGSREEDFDFNWINQEVPEPDAKVDLLIALHEFRRDSDPVRTCSLRMRKRYRSSAWWQSRITDLCGLASGL